MRKQKKIAAVSIATALCACAFLAGCSTGATNAENTNAETAESTLGEPTYDEFDFTYSKKDTDATYDEASATKISLNDSIPTVDGSGATVTDNVIKITNEGTYVLSGTTTKYTVSVEGGDEAKVQIVLDNTNITAPSGSSAINVVSADKVFITVPEGTESSIADTGEKTDDTSAITAESDLTINGNGSLKVTSVRGDGVNTNDDLVVVDTNLSVATVDDALVGKDSVKIKSGTITLNAEGDGVKSAKDDKAGKGFISVDGGALTITATDDGFDSARYIRVADVADINIKSGDDAVHTEGSAIFEGGETVLNATDDGVHAKYDLDVKADITVSASYEGLEAHTIELEDGDIVINSTDDGLNAVSIKDETDTDTSSNGTDPGKQAAHTDASGNMTAPDNTNMPSMPDNTNVPSMPENGNVTPPDNANVPSMPDNANMPSMPSGDNGGQQPGANGGGQQPNGDNDAQQPSDDMTPPSGDTSNAAAPTKPSGDMRQATPGSRSDQQQQTKNQENARGDSGSKFKNFGGMMDADETCSITISGGTLTVFAAGDGVDSNGTYTQTGGTVVVNGSKDGGNAALDYGTAAYANGGTAVFAGPSGMVEDFSSSSTSKTAKISVSASKGQNVKITDAEGTVLADFTTQYTISVIQVAVPQSTTITVSVDGTETQTQI